MKLAKDDDKVRYQNYPALDQCCKLCVMYVDPNQCSKVGGFIRPDGWCKLFERKKQVAV